ncbi:hypothetical protein ACRAVF_12610 [Bradyrhizobium oligotrophicum S58]
MLEIDGFAQANEDQATNQASGNACRSASLQPNKNTARRRNVSMISRVVATPDLRLPFTIASRFRDHIIRFSRPRRQRAHSRSRHGVCAALTLCWTGSVHVEIHHYVHV